MNDLCTFDDITPQDVDAVGGKGLSLGLLARAGLPVPPGFCITTAVHRRHHGHKLADDLALSGRIDEMVQRLGEGPVAVRSSATAEDGTAASFAGQQETILGVVGTPAICAAVQRCWDSLKGERARAYRRQQGIDDQALAMAVVVQRLVEAEVAGVLFTRNPLDPAGQTMLVEASWGLGESVVSGKVMPDRFTLDHATGAVRQRQIATKNVQTTARGVEPVPAERQIQPCLSDAQLADLAELGRRVEACSSGPRDVEWAWADGRFWLLQARPITTAGAAEREQVRREELAALRARAEPGGTVWSRFNLSEILPEPTPLTWSIVRHFMSGQGGFGQMYRDLGFDPDPALDQEGVFDLVCGRPYCNLSREPRLHYHQLPFEHSFAALKVDPTKAIYPRPTINPARGGWKFWAFLPITLFSVMTKMVRAGLRQQALLQSFPQRFRQEIVPQFAEQTEAESRQDLAGLDGKALLERLEFWRRRTLEEFARDSLKPTALAALALGSLEAKLARSLGPARAHEAMGELVMGVRPDPEADLPGAVRDVAKGRLSQEEFHQRFGHRGNGEMELAQPRWAEDHSALDRLLAAGHIKLPIAAPEEIDRVWERIAAEAKLSLAQQTALKTELNALRTQLALRETAKHYVMRGYALLRRILVELDHRYRLSGGIFFLTLEELPRLVHREDLSATIATRKRRRTLALSLECPPVLFSDDLEAIGRPVIPAHVALLRGVPLSAGIAEAPALVLTEPTSGTVPDHPYILVCPSTDPAWVPLFVQARGLVMETGGVLSHGAIVAREFGLPAVAGLPGATRQLQTGQLLRVDGVQGIVTLEA
jgi:pyruvate,water dikinase